MFEPIEVTEFDIYEPAEELSWADINMYQDVNLSTSSCGGIAIY